MPDVDPGSGPITVVIVDDHALFREGVQAILSTVDDIAVVAEAFDGPAGSRQSPSTIPMSC